MTSFNRPSSPPQGYEFVRALGEGARAFVFLARASGARMSELVVVKRLHRYLTTDETALHRFLAKTARAAAVKHPNVVGIKHVGIDDEGHFVVSEYVEGSSLHDVVVAAHRRGERVPVRIVARVLLDTLAGLDAGHRAGGAVHRDVTPHHILIGRDGVAKLTDFSNAAFEVDGGDGRLLLGRPLYWPPEHAQRALVDAGLDLFALGVSAWFGLSGERPWFVSKSDETDDVLPPLRPLVPEIDPALEAVILRACKRQPELRFTSAAEMAKALEAALAPLGGAASTAEVAAFVRKTLREGSRWSMARVIRPRVEPSILERLPWLARLQSRPGRSLIATLVVAVLIAAIPTVLWHLQSPAFTATNASSQEAVPDTAKDRRTPEHCWTPAASPNRAVHQAEAPATATPTAAQSSHASAKPPSSLLRVSRRFR